MAVFTIQTPSGKKLKIEAADQETAIRGAQEWEAQNGAPSPAPKDAPVDPAREADIQARIAKIGPMESGWQGAFFSGFPGSDEFGSAGGALGNYIMGRGTLADNYQLEMEARARSRGDYAKQHPILAPALSVAGSLLSTPAGAAAGTLGQVLKQGAVIGGLSGLGEGQGTDRFGNAIIGGASGAALGGALHGVGSVLARGANAAPTAGQEALAAAERLGTPMPAVVASDSRAARMLGQGVGGTFAGAPVPDAILAGTKALGAKAEQIAANVAPGGDKAVVGSGLKSALEDYIANVSKAKVSAGYNAVDKMVDPKVATPLANTASAIQDIAARRAQAALPGTGAAADFVAEGVGRPGLTYEGVKGLRTAMRENMKDPARIASMAGTEGKQVYSGLSQDLENAVLNAGGPDALKAQQVANRYARMMANKNKALDKALGSKSDEQVFNTLANAARAGGSENALLLARARSAIPKQEWDGFAASMIQTLGRDNVGEFSPARFLTDYGKITDAGRNQIFASPGLKSALDDLHKVSERFAQVEKLANHSKTGNTVSAGAFIAGMYANPVATMTAALGTNAVARLLARPATVRAMSKWSAAYNLFVKAKSPGTAKILQKATPGLAASVARELGQTGQSKAIADAIMSTIVTNAQSSQSPQATSP